MKVLNFGSLNYDYTYQVSHMVRPGETLSSSDLKVRCGGKGFNQSVALARAGIAVSHAGMVGEEGDMLLTFCRNEGIDTRFVRSVPGKSGHAIIQVNPQGENCILLYGGANQQNTREQTEEVLAAFGPGDILLLQNEVNRVRELMEEAWKRGMRIVLNPSPCDEKILSCPLEKTDTFLINETEGCELSGAEEPEEILDRLLARFPQSKLVLTLGSKGVWYGAEAERIFVPAFSVQAVDTTAAGDTFTGYYLSGVLQGLPVEETLRRACAASALAVMKEGAADSIPKKEEVEAFLRIRETAH